jgi:hypothetical protein
VRIRNLGKQGNFLSQNLDAEWSTQANQLDETWRLFRRVHRCWAREIKYNNEAFDAFRADAELWEMTASPQFKFKSQVSNMTLSGLEDIWYEEISKAALVNLFVSKVAVHACQAQCALWPFALN